MSNYYNIKTGRIDPSKITTKKIAPYTITNQLSMEISEIFFLLGIKRNTKGCTYLVDAILIAIDNPNDIVFGEVKENIYKKIAKMRNTTAGRVYNCINSVVRRIGSDKNNIEKMNTVLGCYCVGKPTAIEFINIIASYLRNKL